ncbi:indole-3-glycerol-phosphate synthase [bacterium]|nr:MAG: indole-3-glycerol-phosphate synthase [bacterium]
MNSGLSFSGSIIAARTSGSIPLVADIKPISPRDGDLIGKRKPADLAVSLVDAGACALSVVTEPEKFGGSLQMLEEVAQAVPVPVLRKDFIVSPQQIDESIEAGASAILLTLATIPELDLPGLFRRAQSLGIEPLVEVHSVEEMKFALGLDLSIVGINNRDILKLEKDPGDVRMTERLAPMVPEGVVTISESSLLTGSDIRRALDAGADAVLVGTAILQAEDPAARLRELIAEAGG